VTATRIEVFDVPPDEDEAFLAAWDDEARDARLHRALRRDVAARFVAVGPAQLGGYTVVEETGDVDGAGGVIAIDLFAEPQGGEERFLAAWRSRHDDLAARRGYLGTRLYRGGRDDELAFVCLTRWSSPLMVARAGGEAAHAAGYEVLRG
jgi:heme-degrading monooxygenase HmoA